MATCAPWGKVELMKVYIILRAVRFIGSVKMIPMGKAFESLDNAKDFLRTNFKFIEDGTRLVVEGSGTTMPIRVWQKKAIRDMNAEVFEIHEVEVE